MKITGDKATDVKKIRQQHNRSAKKVLRVIEETRPLLKQAKAQYRSASAKMERRRARLSALDAKQSEINDEIARITKELRKQLNNVTNKRQRIYREYNNFRWSVESANRRITNLNEELETAKNLLGGTSVRWTVKKRKNAESLLDQLYAVADFIDMSQPIDYSPNRFSWTTVPIYIKDRDGLPIPYEFGRFKFTVRRKQDGRMVVGCKSVDRPDLSYPHPHVQRSGPCLGNAQQQLRVALMNGNIADAITVGNEYLTSYNQYSPYRNIHTFVKTTLWRANNWCPCGTLPKYRCACTTCACGTLIEGLGRRCGSCHKCCDLKHTTVEDGWGVHGSSCAL